VNWSRFGMNHRAFRPTVDTESYYPASAHEAAMTTVAGAFARRDPIVLLDGPPGTGKSLVARRWLQHLPPDVPRVVVPNVHAAQPAELLQAILFDLDLPYQGLAEQELRLAVTGRLLADSGEFPTALLIDDAQHLTHAAIEELRLMGNIEGPCGAAVFVLLVAQPSLRSAIERPAYAAFAQRVATRPTLEPLSADESADYLRHQVRAAGGDPGRVFDDAAVAIITGACGGVPRVLNQAAGLAIELAAGGEADLVDAEAALEALERLGLRGEADDGDEPVAVLHPKPAPEVVRRSKVKPARKRSA
jgi:type II secretory pathway predicted ATPase ExeA